MLRILQKTVGDDLTYKIIGCAMRVHQEPAGGFQEVIYQRCLALDMKDQGIPFHREKEQPIFYKDVRVGRRRADFVVADTVIVELEVLYHLTDIHLRHAKNYGVAYNFSKGLPINFGGKSLEYKLLHRSTIRQD